ncbi:MAG: patatin-like phospholipase family protein [Gammaproteobacteria bacterium]|nr:patatin-like phospholipase family protein [Gammaproteobacteria bacterium]
MRVGNGCRARLSGLAVALLLGTAAGAAPADPPAAAATTPASRPRIGLVLGGGGAKGAAHIGVLRVLDELHIPVDCVAGTSMGALVGGTFAAGMPAAEIEREVLAINWAKTVGTEGLRDRTPIREKLAGASYTNNIRFGLRNGKLQVPGGLLKTQDIEDVIRGLVGNARLTRDFDDLPIPFRAVATDMLGGRMVVLDSGDLSVAMRASMAVPGAFAPVVIDGQVLADGGQMRNLPVDIARSLCADVVIAVSLASPPPKAEDLQSAVSLAARSLEVMVDANQNAQIATLGPQDVSIVVPMGDIGSASFERVPDAIPLGRAAAEKMQAELSRYALTEEQYLAWRQSIDSSSDTGTRLAAVRIEGLQRVNPRYVEAQLRNAKVGAEVTNAQITEDTGRIFALGDFERVEYAITGPADAATLEIRPVEKSWGPTFLRFDLGLAANGDSLIQAIVRADIDRTWVNSYGGEWHSSFQIGTQMLAQTDFYQPMDLRQRFFVQPMARYEANVEDIFDDGERIARYFGREAYGQVDLGMNLDSRAQVRVGLRSGWYSYKRDTGPSVLPDLDWTGDSTVRVGFVWDTRDIVGLPTRGTFINARYAHGGGWLGGDRDYALAEGVITKVVPILRGDGVQVLLGGGKDLSGELPATEQFQLGGIRTFPGLQRGELRGTSYWYAGGAYSWKLADIQSLFSQALYASLRLQAGRMGDRLDRSNDEADTGALYGAAASIGGRSPAGPFIISLGVVDNGSWQLQLALGRPIPEGSILDEVR